MSFEFKMKDETESPSGLIAFFKNLSDESRRHYGRWFTEEDVSKAYTDRSEIGVIVFDGDKEIGYGHLNLFSKPSRRYQGSVGLVIADSNQSQGLGTKLLTKLLQIAEERNLKKVWAHVHADNLKSLKLFFKLGFVLEAYFKDDEWYGDKPVSVISVAKFLGD